jgi:hypothetical protein
MSERVVALIEEAKADLVRRHAAMKKLPLHKPRAWAYWAWFFVLAILGLWCLLNALVSMYLGDSWRMLYSYTMFMANAATLTVHHENYLRAVSGFIDRRSEMEVLDRFVVNMLAEYDADIARLRESQP